MPRSLNCILLIGRVSAKPELLTLRNNTVVSKFTLATSETVKNKVTNEAKTHTEWHRIILYGKLAELADTYLDKGSLVYLSGKVRTRQFKDNSATMRYITEICGEELIFLDKRGNKEIRNSSDSRSDNPDADALGNTRNVKTWINQLTDRHRYPS